MNDQPSIELTKQPYTASLLPRTGWAKVASAVMAFMFVAGGLIMALNLGGLLLTMRAPKVHDPALFVIPNDVTLTPYEFWKAVAEANRGDDREAAIGLTMAVNEVMLHYWVGNEGQEPISLRPPVWENYWLWLMSHVKPKRFRYYEFMNPRQAVERGVGLCSQQALILEQLLEERGIRGEMVGLEGHVVVAAHLRIDAGETEEWLLDPDYGVAIPHSLAVIERHPDLIRRHYLERGYSEKQADTLAAIYGPENNLRFESVRDWHRHKYDFERASYAAKWAVPLLMMLPWAVWKGRALRRQRRHHPVPVT